MYITLNLVLFWRFCPQKCSGMVPELWYINPTFHHELSSLSFLSSASILVLSALLLSLPSVLFSFWPTHLYLFSSPKLSKCLSLCFSPPSFQTKSMIQFSFTWFLCGDVWLRQLSVIPFCQCSNSWIQQPGWSFVFLSLYSVQSLGLWALSLSTDSENAYSSLL